MSIKKVVAFTGIRSDYDLLSNLYKELHLNNNFEIKLIVGGTHLSERLGYSFKQIQEDEIPVLAKIESLLDSNNLSGRVKSLSILMQGAIQSIADYEPDLIIVAGDREDVLAGATIGAYMSIPIAHFFGGDHTTDGHIDNPIRHATSKLANIHFVSNKYSKHRLIALGEEQERIFNVGSPSLDKFLDTVNISKEELFIKLGLNKNIEKYAILIFHPVAREEQESGAYLKIIMEVLKDKGIFTFVSYPNSDSGNLHIIEVIDRYKENDNFYIFNNLSRIDFVNLFRHSDLLIGNSSAGIYEAPLLKKPVINVGNRQIGRYAAENVQFIEADYDLISAAIEKTTELTYKKLIEETQSIYGNGDSVGKIVKILSELDLKKYVYKRKDPLEVFYEQKSSSDSPPSG